MVRASANAREKPRNLLDGSCPEWGQPHGFEDLAIDPDRGRQECPGIIPAHAEGRLGEIVYSEAEEFCVTCNLVGDERGPRDLDHRADEIVKSRFFGGGAGSVLRVDGCKGICILALTQQ